MQRRLASIMVGDIVGSTVAMERDEEAAVSRISACLDAVSDTVASHSGRVFGRAGDAVLAEFQSPVNALRAAMAARSALLSVPGATPKDMRFGLHLADVLVMGEDLRGDGVNLAARIQAAASPGEIEVSGALFEQVRRNSPCIFDEVGRKNFKGVSEPIAIYRVREPLDRNRFRPLHIRTGAVLGRRPFSLAVMPFKWAGGSDDDQQWIADGFTEDLILELGRFRRLFVASPSASMNLETEEPRTVGDRLGVRYLLTGSLRIVASTIRLNLSLIETESGGVVWSDRIRRPFSDLVEIMDEVTATVAATVLGRVEEADVTAARVRPPESMTAYEYFLRGLDYHRRGGITDENLREAARWFERAIDADPTFARARAMYVCAASSLRGYDLDEGVRRCREALALDPNDPEAHRILASILLGKRDYEGSRIHSEKVLKLAPNDAYIVGRCACFYLFTGDSAKALELLDRARELDPFLPVWIEEERIAVLYTLGQFDDALEAAQALPFQTRRVRLYRAACRVARGDSEGAKQIIAGAVAENPGLDTDYVRYRELYRDEATLELLLERLRAAGLPDS